MKIKIKIKINIGRIKIDIGVIGKVHVDSESV